jgi:hypothetical protein
MLKKEAKNKIVKNILSDIEKYSIAIDEFELYLSDRINYEYEKINTDPNNFKTMTIYSDEYDMENDTNRDLVFEDFIGKDEKLNTYNSCEQNTEYMKNNAFINVNGLAKKYYRNTINSINNIVTSCFNIGKINILIFVVLLISNIFLVFYNFVFSILTGIINFIYYSLLYKPIKFLFFVKYILISKKNDTALDFIIDILLIIVNFLTSLLKFIMNFIKTILNLFNRFFQNVENVFDSVVKISNTSLYSRILRNNVDRNARSSEHKEVLDKIYKESLDIFKKLVLQSSKYFKNFKFAKMKKEVINSKNIKNETLKEFYFGLETIEKEQIKKKIYKKQLNKHLNINSGKMSEIAECEKNINKNLKKIIEKNNIIMGESLFGKTEKTI